MNISLKNNEDAVSALLKIEVVKADYANQVEKSLRAYRQKADIPGFRKGMVPMGIVKKMYGKYVLVEEVNKLVSDSLYKYIRENELSILGEPLPNETEQKEIDFDIQEDYDFYFDLALSPEISFDLNKRDKLTYYQVNVDDDTINKQIDSYRASYGTYEEVEEVLDEKDMLKGTVAELENGAPKEGGIVVEDAVLMPMYMKDEEEKTKFTAAKKGSSVIFNPNKAYEGAQAEIASFLKVEKEAVPGITNDFSFEIKEITHHKEAEVNQELFDKMYGEGSIADEQEFRDTIKDSISEQFDPQSDYKFLSDARKLFLKKAGDIAFADDILKRWLLISDENKTIESVEEDYPKIIEDLKYHLIKEGIVKKNDLKIEEEDINSYARKVARAQFAQYGMLAMPDDVLDKYAKDMLKDRQTLQNVIDRAIDDKIIVWLKEKVKLDIKEVSIDEFNKLFEGEK